MDAQTLTQLGIFAPIASVLVWVIISQRAELARKDAVIAAKDKRIEDLTGLVIEIAKNDAKTATELTLAVRALHPA